MEFNLALNTVIYIMIFIVPGFLFRSFFYRNEFAKEFYFGNLFERFIWTLFFSVLMLIACYLLITLLTWLGIDPIPQISYETIKDIHNSIHQETDVNLPDKNTIETKGFSFLMLCMFLYLTPIFLGLICHRIAVSFNYNFYNYWYALLNGKKDTPPEGFKYDHTLAYILTRENVLYQGEYKHHHLSKSDNDLETVILKEVRKKESGKAFKAIPGHNFCVHKDDILNINLTYIYEEYKSQWKGVLAKTLKIIGVLIYILLTFAFIYVLYSNQLPSLNTFVKKLIFFITIVIVSVPIADALFTFSIPKKDSIPSFLFFGWIAFWTYQGFSILVGISVLFALMIGYVMVIKHLFKKEENSENTENKTSSTD
jgi:membrane protein